MNIVLQLPRDPRFMLALRLTAAGLANLLSFNADDIDDLKLAVSEACFAVPDETAQIEVNFQLEEGRITVEVKGSPFSGRSMLSLSDPAGEGIGLLLMRNLMDSIELRSDESGTNIRMVKKSRSSVAAGRS